MPESRIVAGLFLKGIDGDQWRRVILEDNVLQKRTRNTAATQANLIRNRLQTMGPGLWKMVKKGSKPVATQAVFAATLKFSPLLGDFLDRVVRDQFRRFEKALRPTLWEDYLEGCHDRDVRMPDWSDSTRAKLRQNALRMLAEVGYLEDTRGLRLKRLQIVPEVMGYLEDNKESYVIKCIQVTA